MTLRNRVFAFLLCSLPLSAFAIDDPVAQLVPSAAGFGGRQAQGDRITRLAGAPVLRIL